MTNQTELHSWSQNRLIGFVAEVLEAEPDEFSTTENLIELGLSSLTLMRLCSQLEQDGIHVSFSAMAEAGSIEGWQKVIDASLEKAHETEQVPTVVPSTKTTKDTFPLTHVQRAYWLGRNPHFELGGVAAHGYLEIEAESISPEPLQDALNRVITTNPMLRAIITEDGEQKVLEQVDAYQIPLHDHTHLDDATAHEKREDIRAELWQQVLPADRWPLFEIQLNRMPQNRWVIHISFDILVFDLWSLEIWVDQWWNAYKDPTAPIPTTQSQFSDHVEHLVALRESPKYQAAEAYWEERLKNFPVGPELPLLASPAEFGIPQFERKQIRLQKETWLKVQEQANKRGLTASALLMAVYGRLLAVWATQPHFCLVTTLFSRDHASEDMLSVIGDFTSLMLLEIDCAAASNMSELAKGVQSQLWRDLDHRALSGVEVLAKLAARENTPGRALESPFVFTSALGTGRSYLDAFGQFGKVVDAAVQTPQLLVDHQALEENGDLVLNWDYVSQAFSEDQVASMTQVQLSWLTALAESDAWETSELFASTASNWQRVEQNSTDWQPTVQHQYLHGPFIESAARTPDAIAVINEDVSISYQALDRASDALGLQLQEMGAKSGDFIVVHMPKGWQQIVAVLAILKTGATYVPVDPKLPPQRVSDILKQTTAQTILVANANIDTHGLASITVTKSMLELKPSAKPVNSATSEDLAYVLFTSGSTGTPKGVMIEHRSALNTVTDVCERNQLRSLDRCLMVSSLSFDLSVYDVFGILGVGGAVVIPTNERAMDPEQWHELIVQKEVTVWNSVPALLQLYVDFLKGKNTLNNLTSLNHVFLSGDRIPLELCRSVKSHAPQCNLVSMGGPTETSIWCVEHVVKDIDPAWTSIPYGVPLSNHQIHILDHALNPRPDGVPGEMYISGLGVGRGYCNDKEKTNATFITHPISGERLYRSGDWGRWDKEKDWIEFLGRSDGQVKLNGLRLELGEVETLMTRHSEVDMACALVVSDGSKGDRLVGFARRQTPSLTEADLQSWLSSHLLPSFVPGVILFLDEFPLNPNGKIDRKSLLTHVQKDLGKRSQNHRAAGEEEQKVMAIWSELLGHDIDDPESNFFSVGGNSLLATRLSTMLSEISPTPVSTIKVFECPTVSQQSRLLLGNDTDTPARAAKNNASSRRERQQKLRRLRKSN
ncbi:non-ribosomal peptide synthetase [Vibrio nigripulchritudo]|uniref:non-ribosomal peptide synthetase n=1 Tax=Vibrio nigripulchritudo TaxID=28173 RepID=UPI0003B1EC4A|nr:non-ribosomal peptide synthetase [Vibrio nigripulchritudo]CCN70372.1 hypothetical protein VIBNISFn118_200006 [Vibrio nigripulchritudo SFn118]